jgi:hypothetical protein
MASKGLDVAACTETMLTLQSSFNYLIIKLCNT